MAVQRPDLEPLALRGPYGDWQNKIDKPPLEAPPIGPHDPDMESRLAKLEAVIPTLATKADVEKGFHDLVKWVVGTAVVGMGLALTIMTFVLNNAVPKQPEPSPPAAQVIQAPPPQPIFIQMPPQPQASAPAQAPAEQPPAPADR